MTATFVMALLLTILSSCTRNTEDSELANLDRQANQLMSRLDGPGPDSLATVLLKKAEKSGNQYYTGRAHLYLSHYRLMLDSATVARKMRHLDMAENIAEKTDNDTLLAQVYNMRGIWEMAQNLAPVTARYWFNKSIETAVPLGKRWISIPAEMNISEATRLTGDTIGIKYELDLFEYARKHQKPELLLSTGLHCALYYAKTATDTAELRPYLEAIETVPDISDGIREMIYATFYFNRGENTKAAEFMKHSHPERYNDFCTFYAEILSSLGNYEESDTWLDRLDDSDNMGLIYSFNEQKALHIRARNAAARQHWREAFDFQKKYESSRDSIDRLNVKDLSRRYQVEYEVNMKDREISDQRQRLVTLRVRLYWTIAFIVAVIGGFLIYTWKRRKLYREIVRQNLDSMERMRDMDRHIADLESQLSVSDTEPQQQLPGQIRIQECKIEQVFSKIKIIVEEQQKWRDPYLSRDTLAEMVGCNRTYITEAIKSRTGLSYTQYVNNCRVREAIRILSDPADNTPLKTLSPQLGFLTVTSFYACFKKETGLSPAAFRKTAHDLLAADDRKVTPDDD